MYAIIYWVNDDTLYPVLNDDKTLKVFETLKEADAYADGLESRKIGEARTISIEGVEE